MECERVRSEEGEPMTELVSNRSGVTALIAIFAITSPNYGATFNDIQALLRAQQTKPAAIYYNYYSKTLGADRECRYYRRGSKFHFAAISHTAGKLGFPTECAWDGQRAYSRLNMGTMKIGLTAESALVVMQTPEQALWRNVAPAYKLEAVKDAFEYRFESLTNEGNDVWRADFAVVNQPPLSRFSIWHDMRKNGLPIRERLYAGSNVVSEWNDIRYEQVTGEGAGYFLPVHISVLSAGNDGTKPLQQVGEFIVDPQSIKTDGAVPNVFNLMARPDEVVWMEGTSETIAPDDARWPRDPRYSFPFDVFKARIEERRKAEPRPSVLADVVPQDPRGKSSIFGVRLGLILGTIVTVGGLAWGLWLRRKSSAAAVRK
jgi:hypothetical protein